MGREFTALRFSQSGDHSTLSKPLERRGGASPEVAGLAREGQGLVLPASCFPSCRRRSGTAHASFVRCSGAVSALCARAVAPGSDRLARPLLLGGLALGLVARLVFAWRDDGLWWPDEYYQSLEPAHRLVFGYGWQAWEFVRGARHWTLPGLVAGVMQLAAWLGVSPVRAVELACVLVGSATGLAVAALARALGASARSAAVVATVFALSGLAVFMAPRALGEGLSALPVTAALALLVARGTRGAQRGHRAPVLEGAPVGSATSVADPALGEAAARVATASSDAGGARRPGDAFGEGDAPGSWAASGAWPVVAAGLLLTLATGLRLQNGLFCLGAVWLTWRGGSRRDVRVLLGVLGAGALLYGLVDGLTWGAPFHSAIEYVRFNATQSGNFGKQHPFHYLVSLVTAEGLTVVPLVVLAVKGARPRPEVLLLAAGFLLVHSLIPHKELRFVFPLLPLVAAQAAVGLDRVAARWSAGLVALAALSLGSLPGLTFGRLGIRNPPAQARALDYGGPENRLLVEAGRREDLCGLRVESLPHWRTGGFAYFHRNAPLYRAERPGEGEGHFNYVIARRGSVPGEEVAVDHDVALVRLPEARCTPDPAYDWHLE